MLYVEHETKIKIDALRKAWSINHQYLTSPKLYPFDSLRSLRVTVFIIKTKCYTYSMKQKSSILDLIKFIPVRLAALAQGDCLHN